MGGPTSKSWGFFCIYLRTIFRRGGGPPPLLQGIGFTNRGKRAIFGHFRYVSYLNGPKWGYFGGPKTPKNPEISRNFGDFCTFLPPREFPGKFPENGQKRPFWAKNGKKPHFGPKGRKRAFSPIRPPLQVRKSISGELSVSTRGFSQSPTRG